MYKVVGVGIFRSQSGAFKAAERAARRAKRKIDVYKRRPDGSWKLIGWRAPS